MAEITGLGSIPQFPDSTQTKRPVAAPLPPPPPPAGPQDQRTAAATGRATPVASLDAPPAGGDFSRMFSGFKVGQELKVGAKGFFGSGFVGGHGKLESLGADGFRIDLHVRAPGHDSDKPLGYRRDGDGFVGADGGRWRGGFSADGKTLNLTEAADPKHRIQLSVATPGTLTMTTWGYGGDDKPITIAVK